MKEHVKTKGFYLNNRYFIGKTQKNSPLQSNPSTSQRINLSTNKPLNASTISSFSTRARIAGHR